MKKILQNEKGMALAVLTMLIAILASMTGAALLFSRIDLMISGNYRRGTEALYAADAGVQVALRRLQPDTTASVQGFTGQIGNVTYRSGSRYPDAQQDLLFLYPEQIRVGYNLSGGTSYNEPRYFMDVYQIKVTGKGPLGTSAREIEALGQFGPVTK